MAFHDTQNPGIGGLDELTPSEEVFVMNLVALGYQQGDILYYDGSALTLLHPGTSGQFLKTQGAGANPVWASTAGGGVAWGDITGTLANQTDLQTALDLKIDQATAIAFAVAL